MRALNVSTDPKADDINNPRATALLIYDQQEEAPRFNNATYFVQGAGTAGAGVGGPGPWQMKDNDQRPLSSDLPAVAGPKFVRVRNKSYTEAPKVLIDGKNTSIEVGSRVLTGVQGSENDVVLRSVARVFYRAGNHKSIIEADNQYFPPGSDVFFETSSLIINGNHTIAKGSSIFVPPNRVVGVDGVFSNGLSGYRVMGKDMKVYRIGTFGYEVSSALGAKVGMVVTHNGFNDPIVKIFYDGASVRLLLKSGNLMPLNSH